MDDQGLWDDADGLYYDRLLTPDGTAVPVKYRSMVGIIPMLTAAVIDEGMLTQAATVGKQFAGFLDRHGLADPDSELTEAGLIRGKPGDRQLLLSVVGPDRLEKLFARLFNTGEFLSPHGLRALSASIATIPTSSTSRGSAPPSTTSRPSPPPTCSAGTPTGADHYGFR